MNLKKLMLCMTALALAATACKKKTEPAEPAAPVIEKPQLTVENGRFTPEIMWGLGKMGETALSPDGSRLVYANTYYSMKENKGNAELYLLPTRTEGEAVRLTTTPQNEFNPVWKDDSTLLFARGNAIISMNIGSKAETVLATIETGLEGFKLSPDGRQLLYISDIAVKRPETLDKLYAGLDPTTGRIN
ncbi:MAG: PD40 domain-containing protein, partial [Bacteroidales bacterium]|nr:PD40 domain-containing protein [Bacteroidales bacterium]